VTLYYDRQSVLVSGTHLGPATLKFSFDIWGFVIFVALSLTRGRVCSLLFLASAFPLGSESRGTQDHILLSQFLRLTQPVGPGLRIYTPPGTGWPSFTPGHWVYYGRQMLCVGEAHFYPEELSSSNVKHLWVMTVAVPSGKVLHSQSCSRIPSKSMTILFLEKLLRVLKCGLLLDESKDLATSAAVA
jgi:hypothetical protein